MEKTELEYKEAKLYKGEGMGDRELEGMSEIFVVFLKLNLEL